MPNPEHRRATPLLDAVWRLTLRLGVPLVRVWWRLTRPRHQGALVAIYVGEAILLVKSSYRSEWNFAGGSVEAGEAPEAAAQRELYEEIGLSPQPLIAVGSVSGVWDGRQDRVHLFELHLDRLPALRIDNREIVATRLASPEALRDIALTPPVMMYLEGKRDS